MDTAEKTPTKVTAHEGTKHVAPYADFEIGGGFVLAVTYDLKPFAELDSPNVEVIPISATLYLASDETGNDLQRVVDYSTWEEETVPAGLIKIEKENRPDCDGLGMPLWKAERILLDRVAEDRASENDWP